MTPDPRLCAAGLPIGVSECKWCGASADEQCEMLAHLSKAEIDENVKAAMRGEEPVHF